MQQERTEQEISNAEKEIIQELIDGPAKDFATHLVQEGNDRIIFSARYGTGKTTFLNSFFKDQDRHCSTFKRYNVIHLSPVNYSVATNEDIFKYIKFDILCKLVLNYKEIIIDNEKVVGSIIPLLKGFSVENLTQLLSPLFILASKVSKFEAEGPGAKLTIGLMELAKKLYEHVKAERKGKKTNQTQIQTFINTLTEQEGSIYEENFYTNLIRQFLVELKAEKRDEKIKENILIIDDLDRIDPHHIFRIFNVFAAHLENYTWEKYPNKFGFDKIIFVCDINNIKSIYDHIYGSGVDFRGYINKFYARNIFNFNIEKYLLKILNEIIYSISIESDTRGSTEFFNYHSDLRTELTELLLPFLQTHLITLRDLLKFKKINLSSREVTFEKNNSPSPIQARSEEIIGISIIEYLATIFGSLKNFEDAIENLHSIPNQSLYSYKGNIDGFILIIVSYSSHKFKIYSEVDQPTKKGLYMFKLLQNEKFRYFYPDNTNNRSIGIDHKRFSLLLEGIDLLKAKRII
ncbi:hypothetical protein F0P94_04720 [Adhaeribacter soli]|uniref:KAP NTPase domain-containing protein n=2 Tax=Adhaeribacter soli TaxID=2607655 RepID=A0A5N1J4E7_9BACT|nr:hypothetical protein F0P94_04720 [Adhaeribacter soli]